ncbi:hypothetical protein BDN71DRAFT_1455518 [Pleurotus eryngii]|uniref:Uncharacterized protein n=1 Tax=Pleurotus eryngii TaxID=5323 RepID=A0A9P5ZMK8_PLEER|nr:hypothetical protein BDN71DRAFT_1455518 [Pleurotus eryngii]
MHTLLVDSAVCPPTVRRYSCMGAYAEAEGAQFNIISYVDGYRGDRHESGYDAYGEAREVVAPSCVCETWKAKESTEFRRAEGEGPRGPATTGWLAIA